MCVCEREIGKEGEKQRDRERQRKREAGTVRFQEPWAQKWTPGMDTSEWSYNSIRLGKRCSKILKDPTPGKLLAGEHWTKIKLSEHPSVILLSSPTPGKVNSRSTGKQGPRLAFTHGPRFYTDGLASLDLNPLLCRTASDLLSSFSPSNSQWQVE